MSTVVESRIAVPLKHSPVARFYARPSGDATFVGGTDLRALRKVLAERLLPLPWEQALHIVGSLAAALHRLHLACHTDGQRLGLSHGEVCPQNIRLAPDGTVDLAPAPSVRGAINGYASPEQCTGAEVDRRSDIYSLGVVLYELTAGKRLHKETDESDLIVAITEADLKAPSSFMEFPVQLEEIIINCLAKNPNERFQSAQNLEIALESFVRDYQLSVSKDDFSRFLRPLVEELNVVPELIIAEGSFVREMPDELAVPKRVSVDDTEPVPTQVLHQITGDELELAEARRVETERGVVPAYVSHEFSSNVVRRQELLPDSEEFLETTIKHRDEPVPSGFVDPADIESKGFSAPESNEPSNFRLALPAPSDSVGQAIEIRSVLQQQRPSAVPLPALVAEPMAESKGSGRRWLIATTVVAAVIAAAVVWPQSSDKQGDPVEATPVTPETGNIVISGAAGEEVWLLMGQTPIRSIAINNEPQHTIRIEHEGYQSQELTLGPETWERSADGTRIASARLELSPVGMRKTTVSSAIPSATPTGTRPARVHVSTTPTGSAVWLYVGTTPDVRIGNVATATKTKLRIERDGQHVSNRVVQSSDFDSKGVAKLEL